MMNYWNYRNSFYDVPNGFLHWNFFGLLIPLALLDIVLKGFALYRSARKGQNIWFIALLIVNSLGILPFIYLLLNRDEKTSKKK